jgi:Zn-dependent protease
MVFYRVTPDRQRPRGWQILEVAGVPFYVEPSFLFMAAIILMLVAEQTRSMTLGGMLVFIVFVSLMVHEAGHAMAARFFGLGPITVSLIAFGGNTSHPPTTHGRSLAITLAGPAGSLLMVALGLTLPRLFPALMSFEASSFVFDNLWYLNLIWLIFNLLPIYPMDGGQSLFHFFSFFVREPRALLTVAYISLGACALVGLWLFMNRILSIFIIFFLIMFIQQNVQIVRSLNRF